MKKTASPFVITKDILRDGESLVLPSISVKTEKHIAFTCDLGAPFGGKLLIGHGKDITAASWLEITADAVGAYAYYTYMEEPLRPLFDAPIAHGLSVYGTLSVIIDADPFSGRRFALIGTPAGQKKIELRGWDGCNGEIFVKVEGAELKNCRFSWFSGGFTRRVWVLGDSYLGLNEKRWPYYLMRDGYTDLMLSGFPGMGSEPAVMQFELLAQKGTPEYVVFALGMNDGDEDGVIRARYLSSVEKFLKICKEKGITPILATIPNTPVVDNRYKNEWVRSQSYRYIDFARAVGSDTDVNWYEGMLSADLVHPDEKGAQALYMQLLCDFPEIMQ